MTRKKTKKSKPSPARCREIVADPLACCEAASNCISSDCPERRWFRTAHIAEMSDRMGPHIWSTTDISSPEIPDVLIKGLFYILSRYEYDESRLIVFDPTRLEVLGSEYETNDGIHVGVEVPFVDDGARIEALKRAPVAVRFISLRRPEADLSAIDLRGIDYVTDGQNRRRVKNGVIQDG